MKRRRVQLKFARCPFTGKLSFPDEHAAAYFLWRFRMRSARGVTAKTSYRCPACGWWHHTSFDNTKGA